SDPFLIGLHRELFWELIAGPGGLLFCNLDGARSLPGEGNPIGCATVIHGHAADAALALGAGGSMPMERGTIYPVEGAATNAGGTAGAGDMYAAGVLYGITNGLSWPQAGHLASQAAARIVSQMGARLNRKFTRAEIEGLLK